MLPENSLRTTGWAANEDNIPPFVRSLVHLLTRECKDMHAVEGLGGIREQHVFWDKLHNPHPHHMSVHKHESIKLD